MNTLSGSPPYPCSSTDYGLTNAISDGRQAENLEKAPDQADYMRKQGFIILRDAKRRRTSLLEEV